MRIAIIGAGGVGGALGRGWARAGHSISFGVPDPDDGKHIAAAQGAGGARVAAPGDAARDADVVALAVPWAARCVLVTRAWNWRLALTRPEARPSPASLPVPAFARR